MTDCEAGAAEMRINEIRLLWERDYGEAKARSGCIFKANSAEISFWLGMRDRLGVLNE